jgi:hypothetical protein
MYELFRTFRAIVARNAMCQSYYSGRIRSLACAVSSRLDYSGESLTAVNFDKKENSELVIAHHNTNDRQGLAF